MPQPQERAARLKQMRDYSASRKAAFSATATTEQREAEREKERNKKKRQLANETPEQREARLQRMRDYRARSKSVEKGPRENRSHKRQVRPGEKRATKERV